MSSPYHRTELLVGSFILIGAGLVAGLILHFSNHRLAKSGSYPITVEVRDATGIREGVPVRLGGIDIGRVASEPSLNDDFVLLSVPLEIFSGFRIPTGATVKVGTSGLLGDSFIRIFPPTTPAGSFLEAGDRITATPASSFEDLANEAGEVLDEVTGTSTAMREMALRIGQLVERIEGAVLTPENLGNLRVILSEMRASSESIHQASDQLPTLLSDASDATREVTATARAAASTLSEVDQSIVDLTATLAATRPVLEEFDGTLDDLRKTLHSTNSLIEQIEKGDGLSAALINNPEMKHHFEEVLEKLNRFGFIFYPRDSRDSREPSNQRSEPLDSGSDSTKPSHKEKRPFPILKKQP